MDLILDGDFESLVIGCSICFLLEVGEVEFCFERGLIFFEI